MDPIELRLKNEPKEDPEKKVPFSTRALVPCLQEGAKRFGWDKRNARPGQVRDGNWLLGMGVAAAIRGNFLREAEAKVTMESEHHVAQENDLDIHPATLRLITQNIRLLDRLRTDPEANRLFMRVIPGRRSSLFRALSVRRP